MTCIRIGDRYVSASHYRGATTQRRKRQQRDKAHADIRLCLERVEAWLAVLESDIDDIDVITHAEMLDVVRAVLASTAQEQAK